MNKKNIVLFFLFLFNFTNLVQADENITITTFYPAPCGVFDEIRGIKAAIGDNFYDNSQYCWDGACATTIDAEADLVVEGNVGIGTTDPGEKLHVLAENYSSIANRHLAGTRGMVIEGDDTGLQIIGRDATEWMAHLILSGVPAAGDNKHWIMYHSGPASNNSLKIGYKTSSATDFDASLSPIENKLTILTNGNVGIGTVNPDANSQLHLSSAAAVAYTQMQLTYTPDNTNLFLRAVIGGGSQIFTGAGYLDLGTAFSTRLRILDDGNIGIGTTNPGSYKLNINGTGYLNAAAWVYSSDKRLKENISYIQSGLNVVEKLKPVKFDYINGEKKQAGFIAQEAQEVLPDIVTEGADGMLGMKTDSIIPYLVKAIQEQQIEIEALKAKLNAGGK